MSVSASSTHVPWYKHISKNQWKAFWAAWLGYLLDGFDFVIISLVLEEIIRNFSLSLTQGATLISAAFVSRWFGGLILGALGDKIGRKPAMLLAIVMFSVGSIICALAWNYWVLFIARLLIGAGVAGEYSNSSTYVIESWPVHLRNRASGFLISGFSFGTIISAQCYRFIVPFGDSIHPNWGWRFMFALGLLPIVLTLFLRRRIPESEDWENAQKAQADKKVTLAPSMIKVLYTGKLRFVNYITTLLTFTALVLIFTIGVPVWATVLLSIFMIIVFGSYMVQFEQKRAATGITIMVIVFCAFLYGWPIQSLLPTYLKDPAVGLGLSHGLVANVLFFSGFGVAVGCILGGFLGDWFGTRKAYWGSLLISQVLIFPVFLVGKNLWMLGILIFFQQMLGQGIAGILPKWIGHYFSVEKRAAGLGFSYNVGALGGAVAPVLGTQLAELHLLSLGGSLAWISFILTGAVIILVAINAPKLVQSIVDPSQVREQDSSDLLESTIPSTSTTTTATATA